MSRSDQYKSPFAERNSPTQRPKKKKILFDLPTPTDVNRIRDKKNHWVFSLRFPGSKKFKTKKRGEKNVSM